MSEGQNIHNSIENELRAIRELRASPNPHMLLKDSRYAEAYLEHLDHIPGNELVKLGQALRKAGHGETLVRLFEQLSFDTVPDEAAVRARVQTALRFSEMSIGALGTELLKISSLGRQIGIVLLVFAVAKAYPELKKLETIERAKKIEKFRKALTLGPLE